MTSFYNSWYASKPHHTLYFSNTKRTWLHWPPWQGARKEFSKKKLLRNQTQVSFAHISVALIPQLFFVCSNLCSSGSSPGGARLPWGRQYNFQGIASPYAL